MTERELFIVALRQPDADARAAFLDGVGVDEQMRAQVNSLLRDHEQLGSFLECPASPLAVMADSDRALEGPGTIIGPYKLMEQIGEGGMGIVFVAEQAHPLRRRVALKVIKPGMDSRQVIARFEAERQALAMMDHPNIAKVFDGGVTESGRPYFVMELVRGIPITDYCDAERLPIRARLELFVLVCRAVRHAHQKGIIHRDLKPSNILVTLHDGVPVPKVIDFGVAKATGQSLTDRTIYTAFTQLVGTPLYMSPEQVELSGLDVDTRSDIYALGVLLYELLTGTTPFDLETFRKAAFDELRRIIREDEPPRPSTRLSTLGETLTTVSARRKADPRQLNRSVRGELDWIVMKALEKDRRRRYETANDFAADVLRFLADQPVEACPPSAWYRFRKFLRRNKGPVAAGLAVAAVLVVGMVGTSIGMVWALRAERTAIQEKERTAAEKERATTAESKAKEEAAVATAVRNFLTDDLLAEAAPDKNPRDKKVTVEEVLGRAAARIAGKFAQQPWVEAEIRLTIGETYRALGDSSAAQPHLERALEISRRALGQEHPRTFEFMIRLGGLYREQGKLAQAEPLLVKALEGTRRILGEEHRDTLDSMYNLAIVYGGQGKLAQAEPLNIKAESLMVRALDVSRRELGEQDPKTLGIMNDLAVTYMHQEKLAQAEPLLVKVLEGRRQILGEEHGYTLLSMYNLARLYQKQGELAKAEPLWVELLEVGRRVDGEEHTATLNTMVELASVYDSQRQPSKAESLLARALEVGRRALGEEDPLTIRVMHDLALHHMDEGELTKAEPLLIRTLEVGRRVLGETHPDMLLTANQLAHLYQRNLKYERAIPLAEDLLKRTRNKLGPDHPDTLKIIAALGILYREAGRLSEATDLLEQAWARARNQPGLTVDRFAEIPVELGLAYEQAAQFAKAESLYREALEAVRQRHKEATPVSTDLRANLARNLLEQQRYAEAEPLLRECLKFREQNAPDDWRTFNVKSALGGSLLGQRKYDETEPLLLAGYEGMKQLEAKIPPQSKIRLAEAVERLVQLYEATGNRDRAGAWRAKRPATEATNPPDMK